MEILDSRIEGFTPGMPNDIYMTYVNKPHVLEPSVRVEAFIDCFDSFTIKGLPFVICLYEPIVKTAAIGINTGYRVSTEEGEMLSLKRIHNIDDKVVYADTYLDITFGRMFKYTILGNDGKHLTYIIPIKAIESLSDPKVQVSLIT